jgi:poly-D-alanine transfer protein DltD
MMSRPIRWQGWMAIDENIAQFELGLPAAKDYMLFYGKLEQLLIDFH